MGSTQSTGGTETGIWHDVPTILAAAHELKSPLVLIRQMTFQLDEADPVAARIRLTAERSLQLVEGLTKVARLEDALFTCEPIYLPALYDEIAHELTPLASALEQTIEIRVPKAQVTAIGNRSLLRSVLLGLCDNALTHNDITKPIELRAMKAGDRVIAGVRDYGPHTSQLSSIKRSIGKTPQPIASRPRSSGLGLMIAEQFARHMDAELQLRRHQTQGVTLSLSLPASQQLSLLAI
jgi:signal transduction histidine kinase